MNLQTLDMIFGKGFLVHFDIWNNLEKNFYFHFLKNPSKKTHTTNSMRSNFAAFSNQRAGMLNNTFKNSSGALSQKRI